MGGWRTSFVWEWMVALRLLAGGYVTWIALFWGVKLSCYLPLLVSEEL